MNDDKPLDELYFEWLYKNYIGAVTNPNPARGYWNLAKKLYTTQFTWVLRDDANRAEDGKALRDQFIVDCDIQDIEIGWLQIECSVLEMMVGLSCRASFLTWGEPGDWFWKFLGNLGLSDYNDRIYSSAIDREVDVILSRMLDRTYGRNGDGGLFPCENAQNDQAQLSLWVQLQQYLLVGNFLEHGP